MPNFGNPVSYPMGATPTAITNADFNGDGNADLAVANFASSISVRLGNGSGDSAH